MGKTSNRFNADHFKNHFVGGYEVHKLGGIPTEMLIWRQPETRAGYVRFIRIGHELFVSGDWYNASYSWSSAETLAWMADTDFQSFHGKCTSSPKGVPAREWDDKYFTESGVGEVKMAIKNRWNEPEKDIQDGHPMVKAWRDINKYSGPSNERELENFLIKEIPQDILDAVPQKYKNRAATAHTCVGQFSVAEFFFGEHWHEYIPHGHVAAFECIVHHSALRMAVAWLKEHDPLMWARVQKELKQKEGN